MPFITKKEAHCQKECDHWNLRHSRELYVLLQENRHFYPQVGVIPQNINYFVDKCYLGLHVIYDSVIETVFQFNLIVFDNQQTMKSNSLRTVSIWLHRGL